MTKSTQLHAEINFKICYCLREGDSNIVSATLLASNVKCRAFLQHTFCRKPDQNPI